MSYGESRERRASGLRTGMDIGMGAFYTAIGTIVIYYRALGAYQIPAFVAYVLGAMMVIGGVARFYRGVKNVKNKN